MEMTQQSKGVARRVTIVAADGDSCHCTLSLVTASLTRTDGSTIGPHVDRL